MGGGGGGVYALPPALYSKRAGETEMAEIRRGQNSPLALISSLLSLLQLGQGSCQTLLCTIQLLLHQLDASVEGSDIALSLRREEQRVRTVLGISL